MTLVSSTCTAVNGLSMNPVGIWYPGSRYIVIGTGSRFYQFVGKYLPDLLGR